MIADTSYRQEWYAEEPEPDIPPPDTISRIASGIITQRMLGKSAQLSAMTHATQGVSHTLQGYNITLSFRGRPAAKSDHGPYYIPITSIPTAPSPLVLPKAVEKVIADRKRGHSMSAKNFQEGIRRRRKIK